MNEKNISKDDIQDVIEISLALIDLIEKRLEDNERFICLSAIANASVITAINKCNSAHEIIMMKQTFNKLFDHTLKQIMS